MLKYLSGYAWQGETDCDSSLILHQIRTKSGAVLLACVCGGGGLEPAYVTERLTEWFYREGAELCRGGGARAGAGLLRETEQILKELEEHGRSRGGQRTASLTGVLAVDSRFWMIHAGDDRSGCCVVNSRFNRPHVGILPVGNRENIESVNNPNGSPASLSLTAGVLQRGAGMLLKTGAFGGGIGWMELEQCLAAGELTSEEQIGKRLRELLRAGQPDSGSAVFFKAV